jgi:NADH-quinone oxidoreductase subunit A
MKEMLLAPQVAFVIVLASMLLFSRLLAMLRYKPKTHAEGEGKAYACGENVQTNLMQPYYGQFFPFAFFFTLLHVFTLTIATVPALTGGSFVIAVLYILAAITGLVILFRR